MPIQFKIKSIPLSAIDVADRCFRISDSRALAPLVNSVKTVGLLVPPLVIPINGNRYRIVSGFARIAACQELAIENLLVRIAAADTPVLKLIRAAISENVLARELTVMEKVRSVSLLKNEYSDPSNLADMAQSLGVVESPKQVAKLSELAQQPFFIWQAVEKGVVGLAMALSLGKLEPGDAQQLIRLFRAFRFGLNIQREVLTLTQEIAKRESINISQVLASDDINIVLKETDQDQLFRGGKLRRYLKQRRHPNLTKMETEFARLEHKLKLGSMVRMTPPPYFEGNTYTVTMKFKSVEDLKAHHQVLDKMAGDPDLKKIIG